MPVIFASYADGWIIAFMLIVGELTTSVLAIAAIWPAVQGRMRKALRMGAPALAFVVLGTIYLVAAYLLGGQGEFKDVLDYWRYFFALPLGASLLVIAVAIKWRPNGQ